MDGRQAGCSIGFYLARKKSGGSFCQVQVSGTYMGEKGA